MTRFFSMAAALFAATTATAEPFCTDLLDKDSLPKKYARSAPIYSDVANGWVFTQDQLKDRYDMKSSSAKLVQAVVDEFALRGVTLAIMVAPPRPVVAGQAALDATMGDARYDVAAAQASFDGLVDGLAATGALVPNLSDVALADPTVRDGFYFRRDTHWTTTGAAHSAIALAQLVAQKAPDLFPNDGVFTAADLTPNGAIYEEGSLANVVRKTCGTAVSDETAPTYDLTRAGGLLDASSDGPSIALVGSSFSDRYKRDHYRFGDALARAFDADVQNYSVSGGGPIGAIEAYVLSGALDQAAHDLVIWELPYTESFNSVSFLRQLLGALRRDSSPRQVAQIDRGAKSLRVALTDGASVQGFEIVSEDLEHQSFRVEVKFDNGSTSKATLQRRTSVPVDLRAASLYSSLDFFGDRVPVEIVITPKKSSRVESVSIMMEDRAG